MNNDSVHSLNQGLLLAFLALFSFSSLCASEVAVPKKSWLPDYKQKVGFTYGVGVELSSNYIWRGLYVGALSIHADANVGYGGLFMDMWWNLGAVDWTFKNTYSNARVKAFNPEVDLSIGFSRWGLTIMFMHMYYFDRYVDGTNSRYFDFDNHGPGEGGTTSEWRIKYRVSDRLPLSFLWCTRTWGRDGYYANGELKRAYSSYIEIGYDFNFPYSLSLETRVGMTPWKSMYTGFQGDFAVCHFGVNLKWYHDLSEHCKMATFANLMLNPYDMATAYSINGIGNPILWNVGCGFYLK